MLQHGNKPVSQRDVFPREKTPPTILYDYTQTESAVLVDIGVKGLRRGHIGVDISPTLIVITIRRMNFLSDKEASFQLSLHLPYPMMTKQFSHRLCTEKLEMTLVKQIHSLWSRSEMEGIILVDPFPAVSAPVVSSIPLDLAMDTVPLPSPVGSLTPELTDMIKQRIRELENVSVTGRTPSSLGDPTRVPLFKPSPDSGRRSTRKKSSRLQRK